MQYYPKMILQAYLLLNKHAMSLNMQDLVCVGWLASFYKLEEATIDTDVSVDDANLVVEYNKDIVAHDFICRDAMFETLSVRIIEVCEDLICCRVDTDDRLYTFVATSTDIFYLKKDEEFIKSMISDYSDSQYDSVVANMHMMLVLNQYYSAGASTVRFHESSMGIRCTADKANFLISSTTDIRQSVKDEMLAQYQSFCRYLSSYWFKASLDRIMHEGMLFGNYVLKYVVVNDVYDYTTLLFVNPDTNTQFVYTYKQYASGARLYTDEYNETEELTELITQCINTHV